MADNKYISTNGSLCYGTIVEIPKEMTQEEFYNYLLMKSQSDWDGDIINFLCLRKIQGDEEYYKDMLSSVNKYINASMTLRKMKQLNGTINPWDNEYQKAKSTIIKFIDECMHDLCNLIEDK